MTPCSSLLSHVSAILAAQLVEYVIFAGASTQLVLLLRLLFCLWFSLPNVYLTWLLVLQSTCTGSCNYSSSFVESHNYFSMNCYHGTSMLYNVCYDNLEICFFKCPKLNRNILQRSHLWCSYPLAVELSTQTYLSNYHLF